MGFLQTDTSGQTQDSMGKEAVSGGGPNTGDRLMQYFQNRYPVAGGVAQAVLPDMQDNSQLIQMNAQPKQGGGLTDLLKLIMGA